MRPGWLGVLLALAATGCGGSTSSGGGGGAAGSAGTAGSSGGGGVAGTGTAGFAGTGTAGFAGTGTAGFAGTGTAGGTGIGPECTSDAECNLLSDCCSCIAYGPNEPAPPQCDAACSIDKCMSVGASPATVRCTAGRCVAGIECDQNQALCESLPPQCPAGQTPSVVGACWGPCVDETQCARVTSCSDCTGPLNTCITLAAQAAPTQHCVDIPKGCEGTPVCECMAGNVCTPPFSACADLSGIKGMVCSCPNC